MTPQPRSIRLLLIVSLSIIFLASSIPTLVHAGSDPPRNYGCQLRIRQVYLDNAIDLNDKEDDQKHFFRIRCALWGRYRVRPSIEVYARLNNEFRYYFHPDVDFEISEIVFENLYLRWTDAGGLPLDLAIGRQNIMLGEGFLIMDGAPLAGSQMIYHNAVRATLKTRSGNIDLLAISNPRTDRYLPVINDQDRSLVESDEALYGIHVSCTHLHGTEIQPYYFHKTEDPSILASRELKLHTFGMRLSHDLRSGDRAVVEAAVQSGKRGNDDVSASGVHAYLEMQIGDGGHSATLGVLRLSGDHDNTCEGWNPLLSRWPKWSELYIYTLIREGGVAKWRNVSSFFVKTHHPLGQLGTFSIRLHNFFASEQAVFLTSVFRGWNLQGEVKFRLHARVTGHVLAETFVPHVPAAEPFVPLDCYPPPGHPAGYGRSKAVFLRWELLVDL